jgi:hypothetical protein
MSLFLTNLDTQKNTLTEKLRQSCDPPLAKEVASLIVRGSRAVESAVCDIAHSAGWLATPTKPSLPCGDIDALLARQVCEGEVLVVLCEVNDVDLHSHREDAYESQRRTTNKALRQLDHKASWVAWNWSRGFGASLFPELGGFQHGVILKILVTRRYCPLELIGGAESVPAPVLKRFLSELKKVSHCGSKARGKPLFFASRRREDGGVAGYTLRVITGRDADGASRPLLLR